MKFKMTTDKCDTTVGSLKKHEKTRDKLYLQSNSGMEVDCKQVRHTVCCLSHETRVVHCAIWPRNWFSQCQRSVENLKWSDLFFPVTVQNKLERHISAIYLRNALLVKKK